MAHITGGAESPMQQLVCAFCIVRDNQVNPAVTLIGGTATCLECARQHEGSSE